MAVGRRQRRQEREAVVGTRFGADARAQVLDVLELVELAWHDCYDEISPPEDVIDDMLVVSHGDLGRVIIAARLAVIDRRDLRMEADAVRACD